MNSLIPFLISTQVELAIFFLVLCIGLGTIVAAAVFRGRFGGWRGAIAVMLLGLQSIFVSLVGFGRVVFHWPSFVLLMTALCGWGAVLIVAVCLALRQSQSANSQSS